MVTSRVWSPVPSSSMSKASVLLPPAGTVTPCREATSATPSLTTMVIRSAALPELSMLTERVTLSPSSTLSSEEVTRRFSRTGSGGFTKVIFVSRSLLDVSSSLILPSGSALNSRVYSIGLWISLAGQTMSRVRDSPAPRGSRSACRMRLFPSHTPKVVVSPVLLVPMFETVQLMVTPSPTLGTSGKKVMPSSGMVRSGRFGGSTVTWMSKALLNSLSSSMWLRGSTRNWRVMTPRVGTSTYHSYSR